MKKINWFKYFIEKNKGLALVSEKVNIKWEEMNEKCARVLSVLDEQNIQCGDTILSSVENSIEWFFLFVCLNIIRVNIVLIDCKTKEENKENYEKVIGARYIGKEVLCKIRNKLFDKDENSSKNDINRMFNQYDSLNNFIILKTSGTYSKKARFIYHEQEDFWGSAKLLNDGMQVNEKDIIEAALPMNHILGLTSQIFLGFISGATLVFPRERTVKEIKKDIIEKKISVLNGVPALYKLLIDILTEDEINKMCIKKGVIGGDKYNKEFFCEIVKKLGITGLIPSLGSTETGIITHANISDSIEIRAMSIGKVPEKITIKILDKDGLEINDDMKEGELMIKSPYLFKGTIEEKNKYMHNQDKWYKTGDVVKRYGEYLVYVARRKEFIIRKGININLRVVEENINKMLEGIEVKCIGMENFWYGDVVVLFIKCDKMYALDEIDNRVKRCMNRDEIPDVYVAINDFPRTVSGKVEMKELERTISNREREQIYFLKKSPLFIDIRSL